MQLNSMCAFHNLPTSFVCLSETCKNRVGCETCLKKHKHKYYLDDINHWRPFEEIGKSITKKLQQYSIYKKANILNLQLLEYRDQIIKYFEDQQIYLQSKITEETLNFTLEMQRTSDKVTEVLTRSKQQILDSWQKYYSQSMNYYNCQQQIEKLNQHYKNLTISSTKDVEEPITFLYSQDIYLKFNLQLDYLKYFIAHYQKHTRNLIQWIGKTRKQYQKLEPFQSYIFDKWRDMFEQKPNLPQFIQQKAEHAIWEDRFLAKNVEQNLNYKDLMQYKLRYETLRPVHRIARIDNQRFVSSGSRAIDIWNRVSYHPMKSIVLQYPSYGLTNFINQKEQTQILFGLSNGDMYKLDTTSYKTKKIQAHMGAIKEIVQYKQNIFLTASQDWLIKIWEYNVDPNVEQFAKLKSTMNGHSGKLNTFTFMQDKVLSGGTDGTIKYWNLNTLKIEQIYQQQRQIYAITKIRQQLFASGGQIREIRLWDTRIPKSPVLKHNIDLFCNSILRIDDNRVLFNDKNVLKMIDIKKIDQPLQIYKQQQAFKGIVGDIRHLGDKQIGTGGTDNFIVVWKQ